MYPTDLTVSAVVEDDGRYLLVEEHSMGEVVLNQPGGHIEHRSSRLRSPVVLRCIHDYVAGRRQSDGLLTEMLPLQNNVDAVLANADLV